MRAIYFLALILALEAQAEIKIPASFDRDKISSGFSISLQQASPTATKHQMQIRLEPSGLLTWSGVYMSDTRFSCSNQGGEVSAEIDNKKHNELVISALKVVNENSPLQESINNAAHRPDYPPPSLSVEYDNLYPSILLDLKKLGTQSQKFLAQMGETGPALLAIKTVSSKLLSLFEKRDFKSHEFEIKLQNSGTLPLKIHLPKNDGEHFMLRLGMGDVVPLSYKLPIDNEHQKITLAPQAMVKLTLVIPKGIDPASGLFLYDNSAPMIGDYDPNKFANSVAVSLCAILPDSTRAEYK